MNLLDILASAADEEQLQLQPLPEHAAAQQTEHLRQHYAMLLAAVLTAQPGISETQTRLLRLLLDALKLGDIRGLLFEQARNLEPEPLLEGARLIREAGFAHHLVVDALVLLRLDAPLGNEATRLAGELATFLGLDEAELTTRVRDTVDILGLNLAKKEFKDGDADVNEEGRIAEGSSKPLSPIAELWPSRLSQRLTEQALRSGLQGGLWLVDADLSVDFPWQASDAILLFRNGATLNTFAKEGEVKLADCRLVDAVLDFQGKSRITLVRCNWQGDYDPAAKRTALNSVGQGLSVANCQFSTRNARAIAVWDNTLTLTGTRFSSCGHVQLYGGAIFQPNSFNTWSIKDCHFDHCRAARGGAIYSENLRASISQCEFIACESLELKDKQGGNVAVYASDSSSKVISGSVFRKTSVFIRGAAVISNYYLTETQFQQGDIYYTGSYSSLLDRSCIVDSGRTIEAKW
jgi:hypothetical protein